MARQPEHPRSRAATALLLAVAASPVAAQPFTFELDAVSVDGAGVVFSESFLTIPTYAVEWDLVYFAQGFSLASELVLELEHEPSGFTVLFDGSDDNPGDLGPADVVFGWEDISGVFVSSGVFEFGGLVVGDQDWSLTIFDEVDQPGVDGLLIGNVTIYEIPAPPTLALAAVCAALAPRRRSR